MDQNYFVTPFGSLGDQTVIPIPTDPGGAVSMQQGWGPDYARDQTSDPLAKPIDRATTNWLFFVVTQALGALQATGIPQWITPANNNGVALAYPKYSQVRYSATVPGVTFETYVSVIDNNTSVPGADANWQPIASIVASAADVVAGTSQRLPVTPLTLKSYPGNVAQTFNVATATAAGNAVPLAQAQTLRASYSGVQSLNTTQTLTTAVLGQYIKWTGASGTLTLPTVAAMAAVGVAQPSITFVNDGTGVLTINQGTALDLFYIPATQRTSIALQPGDDIELALPGVANVIDCVSGSALRQFSPLTIANAVSAQQAMTLGQATGRLLNIQRFVTPGTFTYTPTAGTKTTIFYAQGGGGGSGSVQSTGASQVAASGGGGGGAGVVHSIANPVAQSITVGAGGAGGAAGGNAGIGGLNTVVAGITVGAGAGGQPGVATSNTLTSMSAAGAGGAVSGTAPDIISAPGQLGANAVTVGTNIGAGAGGMGGLYGQSGANGLQIGGSVTAGGGASGQNGWIVAFEYL